MSRQLVIMAKAPQCGRVKTRLGQDIGMVGALWWYRHQLNGLVRRVGYDPRWETVLAVSPDGTAANPKCWPSELALWPQGSGNLGDRLERVFRVPSCGPVLVIGTDVPDILPRHVERAFRVLSHHDAVFGPSVDGGFWAIGLHRRQGTPKGLFAGVRWSTSHALEDTRDALASRLLRVRIGFADSLADVDTADDLRQRPATPVGWGSNR